MMTVVEDDDSSWRWILKSMMANLKKNQNVINEQVKEFQLQSSIEIAKVLVTYYYINKLISYKPDFRFNSNFAGAVQLISFTCIPN